MGAKPSKPKRILQDGDTDNNSDNDPFIQRGQTYIDKSQEQQHFLRAIWIENFLSPVRGTLSAGGAKVLDVCCGPGTWMFDNASDFKNARFIGIDIVNLLPNEKPLNVEFQTADVLQRLPFDDDYFDFVYLQFVTLWFTEQQLIENIIPECVRVLRPGGWIEISDADVHLYMQGQLGTMINSYGKFFERFIAQQLQKHNFNPFLGCHLEFFLQSTQKVQNIQKKELDFSIPSLNTYGSGMGDTAFRFYSEVGIKSALERGLLKEEDTENFFINSMREAVERQAYFKFYRIFAEKI
ncbi:2857_t:CDS:2 [Ambispora leptoticha]|uniref:2857_t:CDS:1 n=1 Tax=Ambispora leptoticha TaxID=144679 RepID=A0A9N9F122_9GLOM|nr:2857_t:CDS:2 [Ambispora leptoticha]